MSYEIRLTPCSFAVLLVFCLVVPCNIAILFEPIDQYSGNIFHNILRLQPYKDQMFSRFFKFDHFDTNLFRLIRHLFRRWAFWAFYSIKTEIFAVDVMWWKEYVFWWNSVTGERSHGTFLQQSLSLQQPFPCHRVYQRSKLVPESVHKLRPGNGMWHLKRTMKFTIRHTYDSVSNETQVM